MCEAALNEIGVDPAGKVWAKAVEEGVDPGLPRCILNGEQDEATTYQSLDKFGIGFDLEVRCISDRLVQAEQLAAAVKKRVTSLEDPPEPDGLNHRYTRDQADVPAEALESERSDLHEILIRQRLFYRTAN